MEKTAGRDVMYRAIGYVEVDPDLARKLAQGTASASDLVAAATRKTGGSVGIWWGTMGDDMERDYYRDEADLDIHADTETDPDMSVASSLRILEEEGEWPGCSIAVVLVAHNPDPDWDPSAQDNYAKGHGNSYLQAGANLMLREVWWWDFDAKYSTEQFVKLPAAGLTVTAAVPRGALVVTSHRVDGWDPLPSRARTAALALEFEMGGNSAVDGLDAYLNGVLVGELTWEPGTDIIDAIRVHPDLRRQGVATALLEEARRRYGVDPKMPENDISDAGLAWGKAKFPGWTPPDGYRRFDPWPEFADDGRYHPLSRRTASSPQTIGSPSMRTAGLTVTAVDKTAAIRSEAISDEGRVSVAEEVMERSGFIGRRFHIPQATRAEARDRGIETWELQRILSAEADEYVARVLGRTGIRVEPNHWDLRGGGQAVTDGMNFIGLAGNDTHELTLLHEIAHIMDGTAEGDGHSRAFQERVHQLYATYLGQAAADTFAEIVWPHTAGKKTASDFRANEGTPVPLEPVLEEWLRSEGRIASRTAGTDTTPGTLYRGMTVAFYDWFWDDLAERHNRGNHDDWSFVVTYIRNQGFAFSDYGFGAHWTKSFEVAKNYAHGSPGAGLPVVLRAEWNGQGVDTRPAFGGGVTDSWEHEQEVTLLEDAPITLTGMWWKVGLEEIPMPSGFATTASLGTALRARHRTAAEPGGVLPYAPSDFGYVWEVQSDGRISAVTRDGMVEMFLDVQGTWVNWRAYDDEGLVESGNYSVNSPDVEDEVLHRADRLLSEFDSNPVQNPKTWGYSEDYTEDFPSHFPAPDFMQP